MYERIREHFSATALILSSRPWYLPSLVARLPPTAVAVRRPPRPRASPGPAVRPVRLARLDPLVPLAHREPRAIRVTPAPLAHQEPRAIKVTPVPLAHQEPTEPTERLATTAKTA